jgi:hypothetical protein
MSTNENKNKEMEALRHQIRELIEQKRAGEMDARMRELEEQREMDQHSNGEQPAVFAAPPAPSYVTCGEPNRQASLAAQRTPARSSAGGQALQQAL